MHAVLASQTSELATLAMPLAAGGFLRGLIMTLFIISALLTLLVILAQEGKGGGLAGAFGGAGADAFGVKAGTVNKFTAWISGAFLALALFYAGLSSAGQKAVLPTTDTENSTGAFDIEDSPTDATPAESGTTTTPPEDSDSDGDKEGEAPKDSE